MKRHYKKLKKSLFSKTYELGPGNIIAIKRVLNIETSDVELYKIISRVTRKIKNSQFEVPTALYLYKINSPNKVLNDTGYLDDNDYIKVLTEVEYCADATFTSENETYNGIIKLSIDNYVIVEAYCEIPPTEPIEYVDMCRIDSDELKRGIIPDDIIELTEVGNCNRRLYYVVSVEPSNDDCYSCIVKCKRIQHVKPLPPLDKLKFISDLIEFKVAKVDDNTLRWNPLRYIMFGKFTGKFITHNAQEVIRTYCPDDGSYHDDVVNSLQLELVNLSRLNMHLLDSDEN